MYGNLNTPNVFVVAGSSKARLGDCYYEREMWEKWPRPQPFKCSFTTSKIEAFQEKGASLINVGLISLL